VSNPPLPDDDLLRECVALATLAGAGSRAEADALLSTTAPTGRERIITWLGSLYDGPGTLNPLRPDRLGEALVAQVLQDHEDLLGKILSVGSDDQLTRSFDVLARLSAYDTVAQHAAAAAIAAHHQALAQRAQAQSRGRPGLPGRLALASSVTRLITTIPDALLLADPAGLRKDGHQRELAISYNRLADLAANAGHGDEAQDLYQRALAIRQVLATGYPGNATYQHDLSVTYDRLARLTQDIGQGEHARELYERALAIDEMLAAAHPGSRIHKHGLSVTYERLGDLARDTGNTRRAQDWNRRAMAIRLDLTGSDPGNTTYQRDLSNSYERLGDLAQDTRDTDQARDLYQRALAIRQVLTATEPGNDTYHRDLANSYERLGELSQAIGDTDQARDLHERARGILETLAESEPGPRYRRDLANSYEQLGQLATRAGHKDKAEYWVSSALRVRRELHANEPQRLDLSEELARTLHLATITGTRSESACKLEAGSVLEAFERQGFLTERAHQLLEWANGSATPETLSRCRIAGKLQAE
jgi:tetratricopeptide (TPR) repeat protein